MLRWYGTSAKSRLTELILYRTASVVGALRRPERTTPAKNKRINAGQKGVSRRSRKRVIPLIRNFRTC